MQRLLQIKQPQQIQKLLHTNRAGSDDLRRAAAPLIVHEVLGSAGRPLDPAMRAFRAPSVGVASSPVRIHTDAGAANSARTVQRACRSGSACTGSIKGDPGDFAAKAEAAVKELMDPPINCLAAPEHKTPADSVTALVTGAGLGVTIPPEVHGIFVDKCLPSFAGGKHGKCSNVPGGAPTGAPTDKSCISVHLSDEEDAKDILAKTTRSASDTRRLLELAKLVAHETQHARFNPAASTIVPEAADCKLDTAVTGTKDVAGFLSEMSAAIAEFDVFFKNTKASPGNASTFALQKAEQDIATRSGESLLGILKRLQCTCECSTVDTYTEKVFADAARSWTPEERKRFQTAMTGFIPSFWPKALHKK